MLARRRHPGGSSEASIDADLRCQGRESPQLRNVWEVFTTRSGYVLKSFGAFKIWRGHKCVMFYRNAPGINDCGLTPRISYFYR